MSPSYKTSAVNSTTEDQKSDIPYTLYMYRQELRKRRQSYMRKSTTKLCLTHQLVNKTIRNIGKCTADDLRALTRQSVFKKDLQQEILRVKQKRSTQMWRYKEQQKQKLHEVVIHNQQQQEQNPSQHQQEEEPQKVQVIYGNDYRTTSAPPVK